MNKPTYTAIVVVITIIAVLAFQGGWHHFHPPVAPQTRRTVAIPLPFQDASAAEQAAREFLTAIKDADWDTVAKFWPTDPGINKKFDDFFPNKNKKFDDVFPVNCKDEVSGMEIVSIGIPYRESGSGWTMIPYEVKCKDGVLQTSSLWMQKQQNGQWIFGGGF
jgi:hypothetical protein